MERAGQSAMAGVDSRMRLRGAAAVAATGLVIGAAMPVSGRSAAPGSRVLVMPFTVEVATDAPGGAGASVWLGEAAALLLTDDLGAAGVGAVTRDEAEAAFDRLQLPRSSVLTRATMIRVGELVGASEIVFGDVRLGQQLAVTAHMVRLDTDQELPDVTDSGALDTIFAIFSRAAQALAAATGRVSTPRAPPASAMPLDAFENYVKGLVAATPAAQQRFLESALRQAPHDARVLYALWRVYSTESQPEKALAMASAVPKDSPLSRRARFAAALSLIDLKRWDGAFQDLTALAGEHASPVLFNALGVVVLRHPSEAGASAPAEYFNRAVQADPGNTAYLFNLGYAYALAHNASAALDWLREAVRYDAANADAHLVMSAVLASTGRAVEAQHELDLAKQLGAGANATTSTLADRIPTGLERLRTQFDLGPADRVDVAVNLPAQRDEQQTAAYYLDRGRKLFAAKKDREATDELRRAVYLSPYEDEPHVLLGRIYERAGRLSDAIDEFKVALWCRESAPTHVALGAALLESGDRDGARREATRALALDPQSADAAALLRKIGG
jgi:tetratricopeptide (TPR) repeat protein